MVFINFMFFGLRALREVLYVYVKILHPRQRTQIKIVRRYEGNLDA
jgi:hypothetical protein